MSERICSTFLESILSSSSTVQVENESMHDDGLDSLQNLVLPGQAYGSHPNTARADGGLGLVKPAMRRIAWIQGALQDACTCTRQPIWRAPFILKLTKDRSTASSSVAANKVPAYTDLAEHC